MRDRPIQSALNQINKNELILPYGSEGDAGEMRCIDPALEPSADETAGEGDRIRSGPIKMGWAAEEDVPRRAGGVVDRARTLS